MTLLKDLYQINEVTQPVDQSLGLEHQLEILEQRMAAAKRGLGFANKLKNPAQKKKHMALILTNLNKIRGYLSRVISQVAEFDAEFGRAQQGYEAGGGYASAMGESLEESLRLVKNHVGTGNNRSAKVFKDHDWNEYRVKHFEGGQHQKEADYHTDDEDDAHATAQHWTK